MSKLSRIVLMLALVVAGELVFGLPFNVVRFFKPTMLQVFGLSNTQLGDLFAVYGITAMLAYFPGGALADHFTTRSLLSSSLFATAAGGLFMATIPSTSQMALLYGFWGFTTVFLFWGALIRATRDWGSDTEQGKAFGILEGGRGLVAALAAFIAVYALASFMPDNARLATPEEREAGFRTVVLLYTLMTFLAGVLTWFAVPVTAQTGKREFRPFDGMMTVVRKPVLWAQALIIICAYCCFKGLDNYSLYAVQVLGMDEVEGARLTSYGAWTRALAAVVAGLIADRFQPVRAIGIVFVALVIFYGTWSIALPDGSGVVLIYLNFFATYIAVFALRGVYFALLEESRTPQVLTGAAVGLVSFVGYTPEIFFAPIAGRILDANPGPIGFQHYFLTLAGTAALGAVMVLWLIWLRRHGCERLWRDVEIEVK